MTKKIVVAAATVVFIACSAWAKHPQCAGNPEPEKCEKMRNELDNETPAQKIKRVSTASANAKKISAAAEARARKEEYSLKAKKRKEGVSIGMSKQDALDSSWGKPRKINRTTNARGTREQWVYGGGYLYFEDDVLTSIQN